MSEAEKALRDSIKRAKQVKGQRGEVAELADRLRESREVVVLPAA